MYLYTSVSQIFAKMTHKLATHKLETHCTGNLLLQYFKFIKCDIRR